MHTTFANRLRGLDRALGFDRVELVIDRPDLPGPVNRLRRECIGGLTVKPGRQKFNPAWQGHVTLLQPTEDALNTLVRDCLGHGVAAQPAYAEPAWDIIVPTKHAARGLGREIAGRIVMLNQRDNVVVHLGTNYFSRRADEQGNKRGRVSVVYSDRPSKIASEFVGQPCTHIETRLTGSAALAAVGIASASDLPAFDHAAFWTRTAALLELPAKKKDLGLLLGPGDVSDSALRKRADALIEACSVGNRFFMHNAVRLNNGLLRRLSRIPIEDVI